MSVRIRSARLVKHEAAIKAVALTGEVIDKVTDIADKITSDVSTRTSSSSTIRPFGDMMETSRTEDGVRVGTSWGPAVPVEYGTYKTPAHRIVLGAAERGPGRLELGGK